MPWHTATAETTANTLQVNTTLGLSQAEVAERLARHGRNDIAATRAPGPLRLFAHQFTDVLVLILLAAAVIAGIIGDLTDAVVILFIVLLDAVVGFVQEYRAERTVADLRATRTRTGHTLRTRIAVLPRPALEPALVGRGRGGLGHAVRHDLPPAIEYAVQNPAADGARAHDLRRARKPRVCCRGNGKMAWAPQSAAREPG